MPSIEPNLFHNAALQPETLVSNETYATEDAEIRPGRARVNCLHIRPASKTHSVIQGRALLPFDIQH
jgi:hypothetical protein